MTTFGDALAAAAVGLRDRAPEVLARLGGPLGEEARAAWAAGTRRVTRGVLPEGLAGAHESWLDAGLAALPARARAAIAAARDGQAGAAPIDVWLARRACAGIPPLPPIVNARRRPASLADALALSAAQLREWLVGIGIDQLVFAVGPGAALDDLVRRSPRAAASARRIHVAPRAGELGPRRAAIARSSGALDDTLPLRIGARAIAPHVACVPLARAQLRCRLPVTWGTLIDHELRAHAGDALAHAPTWAALSAS